MCTIVNSLTGHFRYKREIYENNNIILVFLNNMAFFYSDNLINEFMTEARNTLSDELSENTPFIFIIENYPNENPIIELRGDFFDRESVQQFYSTHNINYWRNYSWDHDFTFSYVPRLIINHN